MRSLGRLVLVVILQSLEELRGRLRCRIEKPAVTRPCGERPDLVIVAPSNPFDIAKPRRQAGISELSTVDSISGRSSVLRFLTISMETKDNMTHGRGSEISRVGAQSRVVRAQEAVAGADLQPVQLRDAHP